ncbi:MAG: sigma-70 family RNA polymerase sigma factor, partial [Planctomycetota bacterium]
MSPDRPRPTEDLLSPAALLEHADWVRALARRLVRDDATADDVAQEALSAALERPPRVGDSVRGWLARVVQNAARQRARSEGRRAQREQRGSRDEALPSAAELTERAEAQRLVVDALLDLDGPTREALMLRYHEGHAPAEIARALGQPAGTVRARLSRGLARLRERLDERAGGDRDRWHAALAPLVTLPSQRPAATPLAAAVTLSVAMKFAASAAAVALALLAAFALGGDDLLRGATPSLERVEFHAIEPVDLAHASDALRRTEGPNAPGPRANSSIPAVAPSVEEEGAALDVRFVDPDGKALAGVDVRLWGARAGTSDAGGRLRVRTRSDSASIASLRATRAGFASDVFEIAFPERGARDAGDFVLQPGGSIEGKVVGEGLDVAGIVVEVAGREVRSGGSGGLRAYRASGLGAARTTTDAEGRFRLDGLLPGEVRVDARSEDGTITGKSGRVEVRSGSVSAGLVVRVEAIPLEKRVEGVVLDADGAPVPWAGVRYESRSFFGSSSGSTAADAEGRFSLVLKRGRSVDLETFGNTEIGRARLDDVRGGTLDVELRMQAPRRFAVRVTRPGTGPLDARIVARADGADELLFEGTLGDEPVEVLAPAERFRIVVETDGHRVAKSRALEPAELPEVVEVALERQPVSRGRVLAADAPAAGARVTVRAVATGPVRVEGLPSTVSPDVVAQAVADAEGRFALTLRRRGRYVVRAELDGFAAAEVGPVALGPDTVEDALSLVLTEGGAIRGHVNDADGVQQTYVVLASRGDGVARTTRTAPDGSFAFEHLTPGEWRVERTDRAVGAGFSSTSSGLGRAFLGVDGNCVVEEGRTTWFDLRAGAAVEGCVVRGLLALQGVDPSAFRATLEADEGVTAGAHGSASARVAADGTFVVESPRA